ncbi:hypothetical protein DMP23_36645 [Amycolatopsis sp. A1MSW2902]
MGWPSRVEPGWAGRAEPSRVEPGWAGRAESSRAGLGWDERRKAQPHHAPRRPGRVQAGRGGPEAVSHAERAPGPGHVAVGWPWALLTVRPARKCAATGQPPSAPHATPACSGAPERAHNR